MRILKKSLTVFLALFLVLVSVVLNPLSIVAAAVNSDSTTVFEQSSVMEDLRSSTVNGKPFNVALYPYNKYGSIQIMNVVEYCYSQNASLKDDYGLYIYVYNPQQIEISTATLQNKIQIATYTDQYGQHYDKFVLELMSKSEGEYNNRFLKFKAIDDVSDDGKTIQERVKSSAREYKISGIELVTSGNVNATEYAVGGKYVFTGYAAGYGADTSGASTLNSTVENFEVLELDVDHTYYRSGVSSLGKDHYNEINSVYFAVPNRIFEQYGNLQKIRAEWWEYKTKMAAITSNIVYYMTTLMKYRGTETGEYNSSVDNFLYSGYEGVSGNGYANHYFDFTYNKDLTMKTSVGMVQTYMSDKVQTIMPYAFYSEKIDSVASVFNFMFSDPIAGPVDSTMIAQWIYTYRNDLGHGYINCNGRSISKDLFENSVDKGRTMGYNDKTIDLGDTFDLNSYDSNHSWWDKLWDYGISWPDTSGDYKDVSPIYELKESDFSGSNSEISKRLLVNEDDVPTLKAYFEEAEENDERVILFRFAKTDYYCAPAFTPHTESIDTTDTYVAQQTVFLDFDIIELTFNKDGVYYVIPVVSSPMDIVNSFTPPPQVFEWWKLIFAIIILAIIFIILYPFLPAIVSIILTLFRWVFQIVLFPFKMIGRAIKRRQSREKDEE